MSHREKKAVEADTKAIVGYLIDSHFLLNLHMIYKNVSTTRSGIAYLECMKFLNLVLTHEPLQKLLKDYVKVCTSVQVAYSHASTRSIGNPSWRRERFSALPCPRARARRTAVSYGRNGDCVSPCRSVQLPVKLTVLISFTSWTGDRVVN